MLYLKVSMRRFRGPLLWLLFVGLLGVGWLKAEAIQDWLKLRTYKPPAVVVAFAGDMTMTPAGKHLFYINHPKIIDKAQTFHQECPTSEQTIVLGCYRSVENGIFVFDIKDPRLQGVQDVTAAHEMLHAAYDRLSPAEKADINAQLESFYKNDMHDQRVIDTINSYKQTEPNEVVNEMHSVFGTEVENLPPKLENYYKRYFTNRATVVAYTQKYELEFTSRINTIKAYESQLTSLKKEISDLESNLSGQLAKIESDRARLDSLKSSGQINEYNSGVSAFNAEVDAYNASIDQLKKKITAYNTLVEVHNQIASELTGLYDSLSTGLTSQKAK